MYIYEVNIVGPSNVKKDFLKWLEAHIQHMLALPCFTNAEYRAIDIDRNKFGYRVKYEMNSSSDFELYKQKYALQMRSQISDDLAKDLEYFRCRYQSV